MKLKYSILIAAILFSGCLKANDDLRIKANQCLNMAQDTKVSENDFKKKLQEVKNLCKTIDDRKFYDEIKTLAELKFDMRPLVTAVTTFTCEDAGLAMMVKPAAITEIFETKLDDTFSKVTRRDIDKAIEELELQNSDLFDQSTSVKLGSFIGAQYIICGNIQKVNEEIVITARVIEVKTGKIIKDGMIKLKNTSEITDAIPALAKQLSIRSKKNSSATLSSFAIKYLNSANKKIFKEKFNDAYNDISHSTMFMSDGTIKNSLIPIQTSLTTATCLLTKRAYGTSAAELQKTIDIAKSIFGDTDEVVIHYYVALAKAYFQDGNLQKANEAYQDAYKLYTRTKEAKNNSVPPFVFFEKNLNARTQNKNYTFDKADFEKDNNNIILEQLNIRKRVKRPVPQSVTDKKATVAKTFTAQHASQQNTNRRTYSTVSTAQNTTQAVRQNKSDLQEQLKAADQYYNSGNYHDAAKILEKRKADLPDVYLYKLAACYEKNGYIQNAAACHTELANRKFVASIFWLGRYHIKNNDIEEGVKYCIAAGDAGQPRAYLWASLRYLSKRSPIYNETLGLMYMRKAAEAGVPSAQYNLGCCYANFAGARYSSIPYNRQQAIKWLRLAEKNGIGQAREALAKLQ